jgi:glutaminyl-peptide cyclotransferase
VPGSPCQHALVLSYRRLALVAALTITACTSSDPSTTAPPTAAETTTSPAAMAVEVVARHPHDPMAFTQGLEVLGEGRLIESTGRYGQSSLREVVLETGEVERRHDLSDEFFGEGLAMVGGRVVQLTWREGVAFVYDLSTFTVIDEYRYEGEGWGLCHDGERFVMSDGTSSLTFRHSETFEVLGTVEVRSAGRPVSELNELECVDEVVYANVWRTDDIVVIDPRSGAVTSEIDASGLLPADERAGADVLNGIAFDRSTGHFLITGKDWPTLFEVRFVDQ